MDRKYNYLLVYDDCLDIDDSWDDDQIESMLQILHTTVLMRPQTYLYNITRTFVFMTTHR